MISKNYFRSDFNLGWIGPLQDSEMIIVVKCFTIQKKYQIFEAYTNKFIVVHKTLCFDVAPGRMNVAPNETRTHSCRFAGLAC